MCFSTSKSFQFIHNFLRFRSSYPRPLPIVMPWLLVLVADKVVLPRLVVLELGRYGRHCESWADWAVFLTRAPGWLFHIVGQWLTGFKLLGIPYLVGKIKFKLLFQGPLAKWVHIPPKTNGCLPKMMAWKRWLLLNMAIWGIYVKFLGCRGWHTTQLY